MNVNRNHRAAPFVFDTVGAEDGWSAIFLLACANEFAVATRAADLVPL